MRVRESSRQRKGLCKGTEKPWHKIGKREAPLVEEDEEIERKTTGYIRRRESTELSLLTLGVPVAINPLTRATPRVGSTTDMKTAVKQPHENRDFTVLVNPFQKLSG